MELITRIQELNKKIDDWLAKRRQQANQKLDEQIIIEKEKAELRLKREQLRKLREKGRTKTEQLNFKGIDFGNPIEAIKQDDKRRIL